MVLRYYAASGACAGVAFPASRESLAMLRDASEASFDFWEDVLARQKAFIISLFGNSNSKPAPVSSTLHKPATSKPATKQAPSAGSGSKVRSSAGAKSSRKSSAN